MTATQRLPIYWRDDRLRSELVQARPELRERLRPLADARGGRAAAVVAFDPTDGPLSLDGWSPRPALLACARPGVEVGPKGTCVARPLTPEALAGALAVAEREAELLAQVDALERAADRRRAELHELNRIGVALSSERDDERLLDLILGKCREITRADAGSLYLVEPSVDDEALPQLRFVHAQNDSVSMPLEQGAMPLDARSLAGYSALFGEVLNIDDVYVLPPDAPYAFNPGFDAGYGYRTRSVLVVPMRNARGRILGVVQLINRKRDSAARLTTPEQTEREVVPFDVRSEELTSSLASQAAVALENARLYRDIQRLFDGFIRASVMAIESRDPTTSGHSERVATLSVELAGVVDRVEGGAWGGVRFDDDAVRELRYAALLHDFGKIGVREQVLVKAKKLYPEELEMLRMRYELIRSRMREQAARTRERCWKDEPATAPERCAAIDAELQVEIEQLDRYEEWIAQANQPSVLERDVGLRLEQIAREVKRFDDGRVLPLLSGGELASLSTARGSLNSAEREQIQSHVEHTYRFLAAIPWTGRLRNVPEYAYAHHEKLDGSGYPRGIDGSKLPTPVRIMTIADIYDALTARDRPYKRALPRERALAILEAEAEEGKVDRSLLDLFVEARVFRLVGDGPAG